MFMNNDVLKDIQHALNAIRALADKADTETKMAALQLMLGTSQSVVALAKKLTTPKTKTKTKVVKAYIPKEKVVQKEPEQQQQAAEPTPPSQLQPFKPIPPLSNQRDDIDNV